jgi:hypothetical protein
VMVTAGELRLDPPGLSLSLGNLFGS